MQAAIHLFFFKEPPPTLSVILEVLYTRRRVRINTFVVIFGNDLPLSEAFMYPVQYINWSVLQVFP